MRKILTVFTAVTIMSSLSLFQSSTAHAAPSPIKVYIDGERITTPTPPAVIKGRTLLPLRTVFEALDAEVAYDKKTKTITANQYGTKVVLKLGSKTAKVNNKSVTMDVPAQAVKGRTMVPVRFVSQAFGGKADYKSSTRSVHITTSYGNPGPTEPVTPPDDGGSFSAVRSVRAEVTGKSGDASDITVHFSKSSNEAKVNMYRVLVVKSDQANSFNAYKANSVSSNNYYKDVYTHGTDQSVTLSAGMRDVDGDTIRSGQSYKVFILTLGTNNLSGLSNASSTITIPEGNSGIAATALKVTDISNYGDGRDVSFSFTKPFNDTLVSNYRVMLVKSKDAHRFDVTAADAVPSQNYTVVNKGGNVLSGTLNASARDTAGDYIRNGESYTVFVLSVSNHSYSTPNKLSAGATVTLESSVGTAVITKVEDTSNYGDGRDLQVSFNRAEDETRVNYYRIFVVKSKDAANFNITQASKLQQGRYFDVSKSGYYSYSVKLPSDARDIDGSRIRNNESYQVFVMSVATNQDKLSAPSQVLTLSDNNYTNGPSYVTVRDQSDLRDGRDLGVSFNRATDESNIDHYRIFVVKSWSANRFNLSDANNVSSSNYTVVNKTGNNISVSLPAHARDVDGSLIRNGENYKVFVMAVGRNSHYSNTLSSASDAITLSDSTTGYAASNVVVRDISDHNDGRDLQVSFNRAQDESNVGHYRVLIVKARNASQFHLNEANNIKLSNLAIVNKTGSNITATLPGDMKDVDGQPIKNGENYRVFVLTVGPYNNMLSAPSGEIVLSGNYNVNAVTNVHAQVTNQHGTNRNIEVSFTPVGNESNVKEYRIMLVRADQAQGLNLEFANHVNEQNYTRVAKQGWQWQVKKQLSDSTRDVWGNTLIKGIPYRAYVLTVSNSNQPTSNALSSGSVDFTFSDPSVPAVNYVTALSDGNGYSFKVIFDKVTNSSNVAYYAVMVVPSHAANNFTLDQANRVPTNNYKTVGGHGDNILTWTTSDFDVFGNQIRSETAYKVFVLSISDGRNGSVSALSNASNEIIIYK